MVTLTLLPYLMLGYEVLCVPQVAAILSRCRSRHVFLDPVQLTVRIEVKLVPSERILQLSTSFGHGFFQGIKPIKKKIFL